MRETELQANRELAASVRYVRAQHARSVPYARSVPKRALHWACVPSMLAVALLLLLALA